jgi:hypothetical protein
LELFDASTDVELKTATNGTAENFCLYRSAETPECKPQSNVVTLLRDKPTKREFPKHPQKIVYRVPRKHSARKKNAH